MRCSALPLCLSLSACLLKLAAPARVASSRKSTTTIQNSVRAPYTLEGSEHAQSPLGGQLGAGHGMVSMSAHPGSSSCIPPAVVRLRADDIWHERFYMAVCGSYCDGYGVKAFRNSSGRMFSFPKTSQFAIEGDAQVGSIIRLREMSDHHEACYVGICGSGCNGNGVKLACHHQSHRLVFDSPTSYQWRVEAGSFCDGSKVQLKNVWGGCFVGACESGTCHGHQFYGMACAQAGNRPSEVTWLEVEHPGPVTGKWIMVGAGQGVAPEFNYTVGKTSTNGSSLERSVSNSLGAELSSEIGFAGPSGTISMSTTTTMSESYSRSVSMSQTVSYTVGCPASMDGRKHWLWQWIVAVPTWEQMNTVEAQVRTFQLMCTKCPDNDLYCVGPLIPRCPLNFCQDADCTTCHDGWQR